ncbi:MAG: hypothetical protein EA421_12880 [Gemmatimonadales bacterium]|nr:MAG: hypothetical protein EA421_12880 [Gemmatimonadales bacterium]
MSRLWSRLLEALGRIRLGAAPRRAMSVGHPGGTDALGGMDWRAYTRPEALFQVWGPLEGGPWEPFHCIPLFAALDRLPRDRVGPTHPDDLPREWRDGRIRVGTGLGNRAAMILPDHARPGAPPPSWLQPGTWTILDLPGAAAVEAGAWLVTAAGCQPVCTFDHWPHPRGVLRPERILAELLRWATTLAAARGRLTRNAPPLWICDSQRLGNRAGRPGDFDNRYFLDDSVLPGPRLLAGAGIERVVYLSPGRNPSGEGGGETEIPVRDLEAYFTELLTAGFPVLHADLTHPELEPAPFAAPPSPRPPPRKGFRRSSAGGFGTEVPEPSSGSSG